MPSRARAASGESLRPSTCLPHLSSFSSFNAVVRGFPLPTLPRTRGREREAVQLSTRAELLELLLALDDLGREAQIGFAADAFEIVDQHRLAVGRRLRDAHIARDDGGVDLRSHELAQVC